MATSGSIDAQSIGVNMDITNMVQVAVQASQSAGEHMKANLMSNSLEKTKYNKNDLVTMIDKQCQDMIFDIILSHFPSHSMLGEEDVAPGNEASAKALQDMIEKDWLWIVDPIDGTTNFVHRRPSSVVSIACAHKGEVILGVIYDPYRDEMFVAEKGKGATLNGKKIQVSQESTFSEALLAFGIGTKDSVRLPMIDCALAFSAKCRGLRTQGTAAMELAWIACGRQTGLYELDLNSWDIASGVLLVTEAGGQVTGSQGESFSLHTRNLVASNGKGDIHQTMLDCIKQSNATHILH